MKPKHRRQPERAAGDEFELADPEVAELDGLNGEEDAAEACEPDERKRVARVRRDVTLYIVNPRGAIHECDRAHALARLRQLGWRVATAAEAAAYRAAGGAQRFDRPLTRPWRPLPPEPQPED